MGVKSLHKWIDFVSRRKELIDWTPYKKTRVGIDILGFLYEAKQKNIHPCRAIAEQIIFWREKDIEPIFVFDGRCPKEKTRTRMIRKIQKSQSTLTNDQKYVYMEDRIDVKKFLYTCGCLCVNAEGEADDLLTFLTKHRYISAAISYDLDLLARGCPCILTPYNNKWYIFNLNDILTDAQITYDKFAMMCVLLGCDYCSSLPTISYQRAYWIVRNEDLSLSDILKREGIRNTNTWENALKLLRGDENTLDTLLPEKQRMKWLRGPPPTEPDSIIEYKLSFLKDMSSESLRILLNNASKAIDNPRCNRLTTCMSDSDLMTVNYII